MIFESFKIGGKQFIAFPNGNHVSVLSDTGDNYGAWRTRERFSTSYKTGKPFSATVLGKASLGIRCEVGQ